MLFLHLKEKAVNISEGLFGPFILFHDLSFFFWSKVIFYRKELADLRNSLVLDHGCDLGTGKLEQRLNIKVVACEDKLKEFLLLKAVDKSVYQGVVTSLNSVLLRGLSI